MTTTINQENYSLLCPPVHAHTRVPPSLSAYCVAGLNLKLHKTSEAGQSITSSLPLQVKRVVRQEGDEGAQKRVKKSSLCINLRAAGLTPLGFMSAHEPVCIGGRRRSLQQKPACIPKEVRSCLNTGVLYSLERKGGQKALGWRRMPSCSHGHSKTTTHTSHVPHNLSAKDGPPPSLLRVV